MRFNSVPHRAEFPDTVGVSIGGVLYLPDIDSWDAWPVASRIVGDHDLAFLDATFWSHRELPDRDRGEIPHPLVLPTRKASMDGVAHNGVPAAAMASLPK